MTAAAPLPELFIAEGERTLRRARSRAEHCSPAAAEVGEIAWEHDQIQPRLCGAAPKILVTDAGEGHGLPHAPILQDTT